MSDLTEQEPAVAALVEVRELLKAQNAALALVMARVYGIPCPAPPRELFEKLGMRAQEVIPATSVIVGS